MERYQYDVFGRPQILEPDGVTIRSTSSLGLRACFQGRAYELSPRSLQFS